MYSLAIDTSTQAGAIVLSQDNTIICSSYINLKIPHSKRVLNQIRRILSSASVETSSLDFITVSQGPGTFTGVRMGITIAKMLAFTLGVKICAVPTLEALAMTTDYNGYIAPMMDARRSEVYTGLYKKTGEDIQIVIPQQVVKPAEFLANLESDYPVHFTGDGALVYQEEILNALPDAVIQWTNNMQLRYSTALAEQGLKHFQADKASNPIEVEPIYLRRSDAEKNYLKGKE